MNERSSSLQPVNKSQQLGINDRLNNFAKSALFKLLSKPETGYLSVKEDGSIIAEFGDPSDKLQADINITNNRFYSRVLLGGSCAAGESFIDGWWSTSNLTTLVQFFARNLSTLDSWENSFSWLLQPLSKLRKRSRRNSHKQAKQNILAHYDLGNDLYTLFLDDQMQYSSALFNAATDSLAQAQSNKMHRLCQQLELSAQDHLLEIGSGWGGLAIFAARHYGCTVTTTTISDAQFSYAKKAITKAGLENKIELLNSDYRELEGSYDKIVSVEMIEAVGEKYLPVFFEYANNLLKPGGKIILQAITIADQRSQSYASGEDFIQKHIFPGGFLPSINIMSQLISKHTELIIRDLHDIGFDYARTLALWRERLLENSHLLSQKGFDDRFIKLWLFYLGYSEGGFLERRISAVQLLATKDG
jgi:cyclopropane-fatty-acyl-phospholipid synthase